MAQYEVTLRDYWRILRRRKGIVIFTAFLLGFFSFVMAQVWQPIPEYTASAKIQIESNQSVTNLYLYSPSVIASAIKSRRRCPLSRASPWFGVLPR